MATTSTRSNLDYPSRDGKPVAETDGHRDILFATVDTLDRFYADEPMTYVSGNLLIYYEPGNKRRHVSPDIFVVRGVPKEKRINYLVWEEGKGPDLVIELTSKSTRKEDVEKKFELYRDTLAVPEYLLFDPYGEYLKPSLKGYRLVAGQYQAIESVEGRLPSEILGLHLERYASELRFYDPATGTWLLTPREIATPHNVLELAHRRSEATRRDLEAALRESEAMRKIADETKALLSELRTLESERLRQSEAENERLRRELDALRNRPTGGA